MDLNALKDKAKALLGKHDNLPAAADTQNPPEAVEKDAADKDDQITRSATETSSDQTNVNGAPPLTE